MNPIPALTLASKFIQAGFSSGVPITNMKLQKLIYIADGLHLALTEKPLIIDEIEVWTYGPVVKSVYYHFKGIGDKPISIDSIIPYIDNVEFDDKAKQAFDFTWQIGKGVDAIKLSNWTHNPDSPWTLASQENRQTIPDKYMIDFFSKFIKKVQNV